MNLEEEFGNLSIKFLFVYENSSELNSLLNDLNSLDYKSQQITNTKTILQFIDSLPKIPTTADTNIIIKSCHLIKQLVIKQKVSLPEQISNRIINWVVHILCRSSSTFICEALEVLSLLLRKNVRAAQAVSLFRIF